MIAPAHLSALAAALRGGADELSRVELEAAAQAAGLPAAVTADALRCGRPGLLVGVLEASGENEGGRTLREGLWRACHVP